VSTATSGSEAVAAAREARHDLLILDVMLPRPGRLRGDPRVREGAVRTPVVFLTARDATDDKIRGLDPGAADDYVTKPFSLEEAHRPHPCGAARAAGERSTRRPKWSSPTSS